MAVPMQHVCKMCCRSFSVVYRNFWVRKNGCHLKRIYALDQFNTFSSKQNEFPSQNDFYGMVESESHGDTRSQEDGLTDKELYQKYSYRRKEKTEVLYEDVSYGVIRVEPSQTSTSRENTMNKKNKFDERKIGKGRHKSDSSDKSFSFHEERLFQKIKEPRYGKHVGKNSNFTGDVNQNDTSRNTHELNYIDSQYFDRIGENKREMTIAKSDLENECLQEVQTKILDIGEQELEYIDSQYFTKKSQGLSSHSHTTGSDSEKRERNKFDKDVEREKLNFIDQQYFDADLPVGKQVSESVLARNTDMSFGSEWKSVGYNNMEGGHSYHANKNKTQKYDIGANEKKGDNSAKMETKKEWEPETAFDVALGIRKRIKNSGNNTNESEDKPRLYSGPVDSKGFRILKNQVPDVMNTPSAMVVKLLKDSIIYDQDDILAIEKPYGLPSHGGPGVHMSVGQLLSSLARLVDPSGQLEGLHLVHRLDKQTTGVLLLAKTAEMAWQLHEAFRRREVIKKYWVLTKGVPKPEEGLIDIPIAEGTVGGFHRMVLKPEATNDTRLVSQRSTVESKQAITEYKVLNSHGPAALVECTPLTGVKHQIRVHLAFGLNTPVLGDHKYSHISKVAPQRLHPELLQRLGIRQSKVRHLPMMLHAKSLLFPEFLEGKNIFISSCLPPHFRINMSRLKIKPPKKNK